MDKIKRGEMIGEIQALVDELDNYEIEACLNFIRGWVILRDKQ